MAMDKKKFQAAAYAHAVNGFKEAMKEAGRSFLVEISKEVKNETVSTYITRCQVAAAAVQEALQDYSKAEELKISLDAENK